jgi:hypothetical protein
MLAGGAIFAVTKGVALWLRPTSWTQLILSLVVAGVLASIILVPAALPFLRNPRPPGLPKKGVACA